MNHCKYDAQGFLTCPSSSSSSSSSATAVGNTRPVSNTNERFVENVNDVQCGYFTQYSKSKEECEKCCAMNGMVWKGKQSDYYSMKITDYSASNEMRTYCKCNPVENMKIKANHDIIADPSKLSQYNKKIWSVGTRDLSSCVDKCASSDVCKYALLKGSECWMSDLDLAFTVTTPRTGVISIKKNI